METQPVKGDPRPLSSWHLAAAHRTAERQPEVEPGFEGTNYPEGAETSHQDGLFV